MRTFENSMIREVAKMKRAAFILLLFAGSVGAGWAMTNGYSTRFEVLSGRILHRAEQLRDAADGPVLDAHEVDRLLIELKDLISQCEEAMPFVESPYPGRDYVGYDAARRRPVGGDVVQRPIRGGIEGNPNQTDRTQGKVSANQ